MLCNGPVFIKFELRRQFCKKLLSNNLINMENVKKFVLVTTKLDILLKSLLYDILEESTFACHQGWAGKILDVFKLVFKIPPPS